MTQTALASAVSSRGPVPISVVTITLNEGRMIAAN